MNLQNQSIIKISSLIVLSILLFFIHSWKVLGLLIILQTIIWLCSKIKIKPLIRSLLKLKWFFIIIIISYSFITPYQEAESDKLNLYFFTLKFYVSGLQLALLMLSRVCIMLMVSIWIRLSSSQTQFIEALRWFKIPNTVAIVIDLSLSQLSQEKRKQKKSEKKLKKTLTFNEFKNNKAHFFEKLITKNHLKSNALLEKNYPDMDIFVRKDVVIILSIVVAIMSLKFLQMLPGLPFAPGHKNLVIIPLIMLASLSTNMKYGGLAVGFSAGIVSFLLGFGKFGIFEILHFVLPGLVSDWLTPFIQNSKGKTILLKLALMGGLIGFTRFAANFSVLLLVGAPKLAWLVMFPMLISQIIFGMLSSFICLLVIKKHYDGGWFDQR